MKTKEMSPLNVALVIVAVAALVVSFSGIIGGNSVTVSQSPDAKTITATGSAEASAAPDMVRASFGVETSGATAADAQAANSEVSNRIMQVVSAAGIDSKDVKTTQLSVYPNTRYDPRTGEVSTDGYRATHVVAVETDRIDGIGEIIDAVVDAGANRVDQVYFFLSDAEEREIRKQLLDQAASEARSKADGIAAGLGARITGVSSASESSFSVVPFYATAALEKSAGDSTQIAPGEVEVSAAVSVSFDIA